MTEADLKDLEMRLTKGWVIRPDQIRSLIAELRKERDKPQAHSASPYTPLERAHLNT